MLTPEDFARSGDGHLPGHLGIVVTEVGVGRLRAELHIKPFLMAPNGYLHAGTVVAMADTAAGYGCMANLPDGAIGFTTIELKSNHLGTARHGVIDCVATVAHAGRTTQVWDSLVTHRETGKTIALFRCTQMILYASKPAAPRSATSTSDSV
jgi:1,4-dihydroxy-2-naphthoyl-CoA hydrolase